MTESERLQDLMRDVMTKRVQLQHVVRDAQKEIDVLTAILRATEDAYREWLEQFRPALRQTEDTYRASMEVKR